MNNKSFKGLSFQGLFAAGTSTAALLMPTAMALVVKPCSVICSGSQLQQRCTEIDGWAGVNSSTQDRTSTQSMSPHKAAA
eukprot:2294623-Amphidinium_carterae.1